MLYTEMIGLAPKELVKKSKELHTELFEARMRNALGQVANPMSIRVMRRDIARIKTALRAKQQTK